jgi:hypothetical protein
MDYLSRRLKSYQGRFLRPGTTTTSSYIVYKIQRGKTMKPKMRIRRAIKNGTTT